MVSFVFKSGWLWLEAKQLSPSTKRFMLIYLFIYTKLLLSLHDEHCSHFGAQNEDANNQASG